MKKISTLTVVAILFSASVIHAQIQKGDLLIGGAFGINTSNSNFSGTSSNANVSPRIGYAIGSNSVISARFGYGFNRNKSDVNSYLHKANNLSAGFSWKKFYSISSSFGFYSDLFAVFNTGNTKLESGTPTVITKTSSTGFLGGINPGIYYMPTSKLILGMDAGGIAYSYGKNKNNGQNAGDGSNFNVNFLNSFTFGIDFIIGKRKS